MSLTRWIERVGLWSVSHRRSVFAAALAVMVFSGGGLLQLRNSHDPLGWLRTTTDVKLATETIDKNLGGISPVELLIRGKNGVSLRDPVLLESLSRLEERIMELEVGEIRAGKVIGVHQVVKELNQALNGGDPAHYRIPQDAGLVAQELLLFENGGADDLEKLVDPGFERTRFTIRVNRDDAYHIVPYAETVMAIAEEELAGIAEVRTAGMQSLLAKTFVGVNSSMRVSYGIALVVVCLLLVPMIGRAQVGLVAMLPNLMPILVALGFMGWTGIPISTLTLLVGSIALGLAVDDTIHFTHGFLRYFKETEDAEQAISATLRTTGVAILFTSLALVFGFSMFAFGGLWAMVHFGIVSAVAIATAFLADITLLPALLAWLHQAEPERASEPAQSTSRAPRTGPMAGPMAVPQIAVEG